MEGGENTVQTTASFGVADAIGLYSEEELIQAADDALYHAKDLGRNRVELANNSCQPKKSKSGISS